MKNNKREIIFEMKELRKNHDPYVGTTDYIHEFSGLVIIDGEEITVSIDDKKQPHGMFEYKDNLFKKIIKKIHNATK